MGTKVKVKSEDAYLAILDVFRKGSRLKDPAGLKNKTIWVNFFGAIIAASQIFGVEIPGVTEELLDKFGILAVALVGLFNVSATAATSRKVGLPGLEPKSMEPPAAVDAHVWEASDPLKSEVVEDISKKKAEGYTKAARALMKYLDIPNVRAFLNMIRYAEGTSKPEHYFVQFNYVPFTDISDKPRRVIKAGGYYSSAAGAYQINNATWDDIQRRLKLPDFTPLSQDIAAIQLLVWDKALPEIIKGNIEKAVKLESRRWASLPGNDYNQPTRKVLDLLSVYKQNLLKGTYV